MSSDITVLGICYRYQPAAFGRLVGIRITRPPRTVAVRYTIEPADPTARHDQLSPLFYRELAHQLIVTDSANYPPDDGMVVEIAGIRYILRRR